MSTEAPKNGNEVVELETNEQKIAEAGLQVSKGGSWQKGV